MKRGRSGCCTILEANPYLGRIITGRISSGSIKSNQPIKVLSHDGEVVEQVWKIGGLYTEALERVAYWLEQAATVAENDAQRVAFEKLVAFYRSGDLEDWDDYNVAWVADSESVVDTINVFQ